MSKKTDRKTDILYIVIPAYNEEANIRNVIDDWYPVVEQHSGGGKSRLSGGTGKAHVPGRRPLGAAVPAGLFSGGYL